MSANGQLFWGNVFLFNEKRLKIGQEGRSYTVRTNFRLVKVCVYFGFLKRDSEPSGSRSKKETWIRIRQKMVVRKVWKKSHTKFFLFLFLRDNATRFRFNHQTNPLQAPEHYVNIFSFFIKMSLNFSNFVETPRGVLDTVESTERKILVQSTQCT